MAHYCEIHKTPFFKRGKMRGYAHPILDADSNDTGEWCNEPEGQTEAKKQEKPFTYSPEKSASIETQVAVKAVTDLWIADKLPTDCQEVTLLRSWILSHLDAVKPTAPAVKETATPSAPKPSPVKGEEKPTVYATQQQKDTLLSFEKKHLGQTETFMIKHEFPLQEKLTKANADILIDEFVILEDAEGGK